jgi:tetraacyldisaccharide 4'-kinase
VSAGPTRRLRLIRASVGGYLNRMSSAEWYRGVVAGTGRGPVAWAARAALWWARLPYAAGVGVRNWRFDRDPKRAARVAVPVVCVGNLTLGGTGKTVAAEYVAGFYRELGRQVVLVSRGYGSDGGPNDEAMVLEENLPDVPHLQGADRLAVAGAAVEELEADVIVLDDGFQHRRLHRDLDVVLLDATRPVTREYLFPRGVLREPVNSLRRAGFVLFTRCDQAERLDEQRAWLAKAFPHLQHATTAHAPISLIGPDGAEDLGQLAGKCVAVFSGIGHPPAFVRTVRQLGATVAATREFPDHHPYTRDDVDDLSRWAAALPSEVDTVLTTQKDWVKLRVGELGGRRLRAVRVGLKVIEGEEAFQATLGAVLGDQTTEASE